MQRVEFVTCASNVRDRTHQWRSVIGSDRVELEDDGIEASIRGGDIGIARICSVELGGHRVTSPSVRRPPLSLLKLVFQERGECSFEQDDRSVTLRPGEWCAYDKSRPYSIWNRGHSVQTAIVVPFSAVDGTRRWEQWLMMRHPAAEGADHVLHTALVAAVDRVSALSEVGGHLLSQALLKLVELTVHAKGDWRPSLSECEARRVEILEYIDQHLSDCDLSVESIARAFRCSKRNLHKLFLSHGTTIARVIWNRRLDRCHAQLSDPSMVLRTITEIAFASGFSDSHHFSRLFKARFGLSPRDFRKGRHPA